MKSKIFLMLPIIMAFNLEANVDERIAEKDYYSIKFGGWSKHLSDKFKDRYYENKGEKFNYNENHKGIGIAHNYHLYDNDYINYGLWYMKDSYNKDAYHFNIGYKIKHYVPENSILESIDTSLDLVISERSKMMSTNIGGYTKEGYAYSKEDYYLKREKIPFIMPYVTFNFKNKMNLDFTILVTPSEYRKYENNYQVKDWYDLKYEHKTVWETTLFIRLGYDFG